MKRFLKRLLTTALLVGSAANPELAHSAAVIFSGSDVKALKSNLDLNGQAKILSGTVDPTSSATSAPVGSIYLNTSNGNSYRKLDSGSSTNWVVIGSGGASGINYVSNPDAEANTTGWTTFADAAAATPADMTGGSPTITWTRVTSTPLRGIGSFLFTKDAANRQGEGVAAAIVPALADTNKVLTMSFDYEIASGTYATGDLTVYCYDVTNTTVMQPAGYQILSLSSTKQKHVATFQTTSSVSYRCGFYVASTSASAYTVKIDNVILGPQVVQYGVPASDWVSYTPTLNSNTNVSSNVAKWRRDADTMEIIAQVDYSGAGNNSNFTLSLPSGYSIDTTKLNNTDASENPLGFGTWTDNGTGQFTSKIGYQSTTAVSMIAQNGQNSRFNTSSTAASDSLELHFWVPISGWSSNVLMSSDTDTRVVGFTAAGATSGAITGSLSDLTYTVVSDTHSAYSGSTYTVPVPGWYRVDAQVRLTASSVAVDNTFRVGIAKNGTSVSENIVAAGATTQTRFLPRTSYLGLFSAGDTIKAQVSSNATTPSVVSDNPANQFSVQRVSGPASIAANEIVAVSAYNSTQAVNTTAANFIPTTEAIDTHGAYNNSTGVFTCPVQGIYRVSIVLTGGSHVGVIAKSVYNAFVRKNSTNYLAIADYQHQSTNTVLPTGTTGSVLVPCNAGDTIDVQIARDSGSNAFSLIGTSSGIYNSLHIERLN